MNTRRKLAVSAIIWPNYICYTEHMCPYLGVGMSIEDLKNKLSWEEAKGKTLPHSIFSLLKGKEQSWGKHETGDWHIWSFSDPMYIYLNLQETEIKHFPKRNVFLPKSLIPNEGKKSNTKLAGCNHPGFLKEAILEGSSKGNTYLNGAGVM